MQENVRKHVKKAEEKRKIRRRTKILLGICCVLVAVGVVWGLILQIGRASCRERV